MYNIKGDYSTYYYQGKYYSDYNLFVYILEIFFMHKLSTKIRGHDSATFRISVVVNRIHDVIYRNIIITVTCVTRYK